jgi:hypothetical protein
MVTEALLDESERPLTPISLAKEAARTNLADRLVRECELLPEYAAAIARAVVDPTAARRQLDSLYIKRFPGGIAKYLIADVFTSAVSINLVNPRERERRAYPASGLGKDWINKPVSVDADKTNTALLFEGESREHVAAILRDSAGKLRHQNEYLGQDVALDGVLEPLTVAITEIHHRDGSQKVVVLTAVDGATRVSFCHKLTGIEDSADVVYGLAQADSRKWKARLGRILDIQHLPFERTRIEDRSAYRTLVAPARILVGVEPVRPGSAMPSVVDAVRSIQAEIHVAPPKGWPEGSQLDEIADKALDLLHEAKRIKKRSERDYLAGMLSPEDLKTNKGLSPHHDVRAAMILRTFNDAGNRPCISAAVRGLGERKRLAKDDRVKLAAELIMRPYRHVYHDNPGEMNGVRSAVQRAFSVPGLRENDNWAVTNRAIEDGGLEKLRDAALAELRANPLSDEYGPDRLELVVLAAYWLTATRALQRDTPQQKLAQSTILGFMLRSERGIHQLYQAIVDGRHEPTNVKKAARAVFLDEDIVKNKQRPKLKSLAGGDYERISDDWLRREYREATTDAPPPQDELTSHEKLENAVHQVARLEERLQSIIGDIPNILDEHGDVLAEKAGIPHETAFRIADSLQNMASDFRIWGKRYERKEQQRRHTAEEDMS